MIIVSEVLTSAAARGSEQIDASISPSGEQMDLHYNQCYSYFFVIIHTRELTLQHVQNIIPK